MVEAYYRKYPDPSERIRAGIPESLHGTECKQHIQTRFSCGDPEGAMVPQVITVDNLAKIFTGEEMVHQLSFPVPWVVSG